MTGQHHSREHITSNVVLFTLLNLLHDGLINHEAETLNLLTQNKYYFIPSLNVDGVKYIEDEFVKSGILLDKRKNMNLASVS